MLSQRNLKWFVCVKLQASRFLVLENDNETLMIVVERLLSISFVVKERSTIHYSFLVFEAIDDRFLNFNLILCLKFANIFDSTQLHWFLSKWKTYLARRERILVQMHSIEKELHDWKIMIRHYNEAIDKSRCRIIEINDFFVQNSLKNFLIEVNRRHHIVAIEETINLIDKRIDSIGTQELRRMISRSQNEYVLDARRLRMNDWESIVTKDLKRQYFYVTIQTIRSINELK